MNQLRQNYYGRLCTEMYEILHEKSERMDFQTHLYKFKEMEQYLKEIGFVNVKTYSSFSKEMAVDDTCEMFLFECSII